MLSTADRIRTGALMLALLSTAGCGAGDGPTSPGDFSITVNATNVVVAAGHTERLSVYVTRIGGFDEPVTFAATPAGQGPLATFTSNGPDESFLDLTAPAALEPGPYAITVTATADGVAPQHVDIAINVLMGGPGAVAMGRVAAGDTHSCALTGAGAAFCWGSGADGQLGIDPAIQESAAPVAVQGGRLFTSLVLPAIGGVSCGIAADGAAYCWGRATFALFGETAVFAVHPVPTRVAPALHFRSFAVGLDHVCGIATDGVTYCWGTNSYGALGDGTVVSRPVPTAVAGGHVFTRITAGAWYTCGITAAGSAYCWGLGVNGTLGTGDGTVEALIPTAVAGAPAFDSIAGSGLVACGLTHAGAAWCWGRNAYGEVGDGTTAIRSVPTLVTGGLAFANLATGFEFACGITAAGTAYCWGENHSGALGDGSVIDRSRPSAVTGGLSFRTISAGTRHSCGVTTSDEVFCWGDNSGGMLGDGTTEARLAPTAVRWP